MTNSKLYEKLSTLLASQDDADKKHVKKLRKVLHKLKKNQREMESALEGKLDNKQRDKLNREIEVLKRQRRKGAEVYKQLKRDIDKKSKST